MTLENSKGTIYYGCHFYPGVAEYREPSKDPYRVFLNEDTLRAMDPSFAGRPVFVMHVDGVDDDVDELRKDADGWVVESFFNQADGKHWVKFIAVSEKAENAIRRGMRLSNCYAPKSFAGGGLWNGVAYAKEITGGEYEHLAIVPNPRYEESVILTPEEYKKYNEEKLVELKRLSNAREIPMKLNLFKRTKVENAADIEGVVVVLPKSKKEFMIEQLVNEADERYSNSPMAAHPEHLVDMGGGSKMTVNDLFAKYKEMCDELEAMKKKDVDAGDKDDKKENEVEVDADDEEAKKKKKENDDADAEKKKNELETEARVKAEADAKAEADKKAKEKADRLRNAPETVSTVVPTVDLPGDQVNRGKSRYGS